MRKSFRLTLPLVAALIVVGAIFASLYVKSLAPRARQRVIQALADRFDADVSLTSLDLSFLPHPGVVGRELVIRHRGWNDPQSLIYIRRFSAQVSFFTLLFSRNSVDLVQLEGLQIHMPPRGSGPKNQAPNPSADTRRLRFLIKTIVADGAQLVIAARQPGKEPLRFDIQKLTLHSVGTGRGLRFVARLTNPKPPGLIDSSGSFGPWQREDPRSTPVSGNYSFQNADLSVFKGIRGILSSTGKYSGELQKVAVAGVTDTPDFALKRGGDPVHLRTVFSSVVDGTDGDTYLNSIDAKFAHSEFLCRGGVEHKPGAGGKTVSLDAQTKDARVEDILQLVIGRRQAILTGDIDFKSKIFIPQGKADVVEKLDLDGQFAINHAFFTSLAVQQKLRTLSLRARGISDKEEKDLGSIPTVASDLKGAFTLDNGLASFSRLSFSIPGATIKLAGGYNLRSEKIAMKGVFRMDATLADTQSGAKHLLLKPLDPFFKNHGAGFQIPIEIAGSRDDPSVEVFIFRRKVAIH